MATDPTRRRIRPKDLTPESAYHVLLPEESEDQESKGSTLSWVLTLFGTAVGAGILFLPLDAGSYGFWPLLLITIAIGPLVFLSHRMYSRIVSASPYPGKDVLQLTRAFFGQSWGLIIAVGYWLSIFPIVLIYGISITNTVDSFIVNQLHGPELNRWFLAAACIGIMTGAFAFGQKMVLRLTQLVTYPLIFSLAFISLYLIPRWDFGSFLHFHQGSWTDVLKALPMLLPVLVFSFNHMPAVSQFTLDMQRGHGAATERQVSRIELYTASLLVLFTMLFVWSSVLAMGADGMNEASSQNVSVLTYFANVTGSPLMSYFAPIIVMFAIISSYFGHMLGTEESTKYLARSIAPNALQNMPDRTLSLIIYAFVFIVTTIVAVANPSVLDMISVVGGIFIALLVYVLPLAVFRRHAAYQRFRNIPSNWVVGAIGLVLVGVTLYKLFSGQAS